MRLTIYLDHMSADRRGAVVANLTAARERLDDALRQLWDGPPAGRISAALAAERALAAALDVLDVGGMLSPPRWNGAVSVTEALDTATEARDHLARALDSDEPAETLASFLAIALESLGDARRLL